MKQQDKEEKQADRRQTLHRLCSASGLLLSCCVLHRANSRATHIQEHHRLISNSVTFCDQMKTEILRKVQQNYGRERSRDKNALHPDDSQQKSTLTASEVQMLIKQELGLLQNQVCAKDHTLCRTGVKGSTGDEEDRVPEGDPVPQGDPG
ncbi:hypothetical protein OS493_025752 [Desmophyllum pertusum]|uniref:Uncharacterized protein n=1 Tax=Desmophyllum pertusum TaxID=174260 RepID=A0A9W9ZC49_9CNID|nr:hypothetical protein OS493_025752 [Desmophyllum pertusum]